MTRLPLVAVLLGPLALSAGAQAYPLPAGASHGAISASETSPALTNSGLPSGVQPFGINRDIAYKSANLAFDSGLFHGRQPKQLPPPAAAGLETIDTVIFSINPTEVVPIDGGFALSAEVVIPEASAPFIDPIEIPQTPATPALAPAAVPEPGTIVMLALGLAAIAATQVRKRFRL